jgi:thiomorpholine-carboxylate dehydrogenase
LVLWWLVRGPTGCGRKRDDEASLMTEKLLFLDEAQVERLLDPDRLVNAVRQALIDLSERRVIQPLRTVMPFIAGPDEPAAPTVGQAAPPPAPPGHEHGLLFLKPAQAGVALATKLITWVPANAARGEPTLSAVVVLFDPESGRPCAVLEANALTALRTAAASAAAAQALARPEAQVLALLGSGVLARSHARLLRRVRPIREIRVWSRDPANVRRCADDIGGVACASAEQAVRGADIICTVSNAAEPILCGEWLSPGSFVAAVGAPRPTLRELDDAAMRHPVIADQREAAEKESGDVILSGARIHAELGEILAGRIAPPLAGSTVIFKSLGLAVEDAVAARLVHEAALREACLQR